VAKKKDILTLVVLVSESMFHTDPQYYGGSAHDQRQPSPNDPRVYNRQQQLAPDGRRYGPEQGTGHALGPSPDNGQFQRQDMRQHDPMRIQPGGQYVQGPHDPRLQQPTQPGDGRPPQHPDTRQPQQQQQQQQQHAQQQQQWGGQPQQLQDSRQLDNRQPQNHGSSSMLPLDDRQYPLGDKRQPMDIDVS